VPGAVTLGQGHRRGQLRGRPDRQVPRCLPTAGVPFSVVAYARPLVIDQPPSGTRGGPRATAPGRRRRCPVGEEAERLGEAGRREAPAAVAGLDHGRTRPTTAATTARAVTIWRQPKL